MEGTFIGLYLWYWKDIVQLYLCHVFLENIGSEFSTSVLFKNAHVWELQKSTSTRFKNV
jgi:hypothetical protein